MTPRPPREAVFLARGSYRQRRYRDLARVLPIAGAILVAIPLMWPAGALTSHAVIYLFVVWLGLILVAGVLSRLINYGAVSEIEGEETSEGGGPDGGSG